MREIVKPYTQTITHNKTFYIADDGTEFESKCDCSRYERDKVRKEGKGVIIMCDALEGRGNIDGGDYNDNHDFYWVFVRDEKDAELLERMFEPDYNSFENFIGQWVCVEESDDSCWLSGIENGIAYAKDLLEKLGYNVEITRKEDAE